MKFEVLTEVSKFSNYSDNDLDYNLPICTSCKYYIINEVHNRVSSIATSDKKNVVERYESNVFTHKRRRVVGIELIFR